MILVWFSSCSTISGICNNPEYLLPKRLKKKMNFRIIFYLTLLLSECIIIYCWGLLQPKNFLDVIVQYGKLLLIVNIIFIISMWLIQYYYTRYKSKLRLRKLRYQLLSMDENDIDETTLKGLETILVK